MKKRLLCLMLALIAMLMSACTGGESRLAQIRARNDGAGELRVGVKADVPNFGYFNPETGAFEGLEVDLAHKMAEKLTGNSDAIALVPTTGMTKETMLANGEVDVIIGTYTITEARQSVVSFSRPYYTDELSFLVPIESGINSIQDISGKVIGATRTGTAFSSFDQNPELIPGDFTLKGYASYPEIQDALLSGEIDVFSADKSILFGYVTDTTKILDDGLQPQPYGIASAPTDAAFAKEVDRLLGELVDDGTLDAIIAKWVG